MVQGKMKDYQGKPYLSIRVGPDIRSSRRLIRYVSMIKLINGGRIDAPRGKCSIGLFLLQGLVLGFAFPSLSVAQVSFTLTGPTVVSSCDTLTLTNKLVNTGSTLDGLRITNNLPGGGAAYVPNQSTVTLPNGAVLSGASAEPVISNGTNLVWDLTSAASASGISTPLITEVFYDPAGSTDEETNEWIEIYNPTDGALDLTGYTVCDTLPGQCDSLPAITLAPGEFMILCASTQAFTIMHPGYTGKHYQVSDKTIGSSLNNFGDGVLLKNSGGTTVDAVSYGTSTAGLNPAATLVAEGNSLTRSVVNADNNSASDWASASKSPGSGTVLTGVGSGSGVTITYKMELGCAARSTSVVASVRYQQPSGGTTYTTNSVYAYTIETPYLNVFKKPLEQIASYGDTVVWTVKVENVGFGRADNVEVVDTRGPGIRFVGFSHTPTNSGAASTLTNVVWNRTTVPGLSALASGESFSIIVTGLVASCTGLYNNVAVRNGCQGLLAATNETCFDSALGGTEGGAIEFNYKYANVSGSIVPSGTIPVSYCGGSPIVLYMTNAAGANVGHAFGVELTPALPSGYTLSGSNYVGGKVVLGDLAPGAVTSTTVQLIPGGSCPLNMGQQQVIFYPAYTDPCGLPYTTPPKSFNFALTNEPSASVRKVISSSVSGQASNLHVEVLFTYANLNNTAVSFADNLPSNPLWSVANISAPGAVANTTNVRWNVTLTGSGIYTGKFDLVWTDACAIDTGWRPNLVSASNITDCAGCTRTVSGSGESTYFRIYAYGCVNTGTNDVVSCGFSLASTVPSVAEVCSTLSITTRVSGLSANTNANWDGVVFTNTLVGRQAKYLGNDYLQVLIDGVDYTAQVQVVQTNTAFVLTFANLNSTAESRPGLVTSEMLIIWQISPTNLGQFSESSSLYLPGCSSQSDVDTLNVGAADMTVTLSPLVGQDVCGLAYGRIDLTQLSTPALSALSNATFNTYDVEVVLDLDANRNAASSFSYVTNTTSFSNMYAMAGGALTGTMPSVTSTQLVWSLGDLRTNGAGSVHFVLQGSCSLESGEKLVAFVRYNRRCEDGTAPTRSAYSTTNTAAALFSSSISASIEPEASFLAGTAYVYRVDFFNAGAATAYNLRGELAFTSNIIFKSAGVAQESYSATNAVWTFQMVSGPGSLVDGDADGYEDDLPPNGLVSFYVTNQIGSCGGRLVRVTATTGCKGSSCGSAATDTGTFTPSTPNLASTTYFPSNQLLCASGTVTMIVRNSGAGNGYNAEARHTMPTGIHYVVGSSRISVDGGPTNAIADPAISGTWDQYLLWSSAQISTFSEVAPNQSVVILYEAYASCEAVLGTSLFTASAQYSDSCGNRLTNTASAATGGLNQPVMTVTKTSRNITLGQAGFTSGTVPGNPGDTIAFKINLDHSGSSSADTMSMKVTDIMPAAITYGSAWPVPDAVVGTTLIWSNSTLMALAGGAPYTRSASALSLYITGVVATCSGSVVNQATLEYGCAEACLSKSQGTSAAGNFTPAIVAGFVTSELQLSNGGGWMTVHITNTAGAASSITVTQAAPSGYVITSANISGEYNGTGVSLALSGSPAGRTSVLNLATAAASGATDVDDDLGDGLANFDLGYQNGFSITYKLTADSTALDCAANPNDADYLDPEPAGPATVTSTAKLGIKNACGDSQTASTSASTVPKLPDPDIDVQPNGMFVTNGQLAEFTVTMKNRGEEGTASNLSMRIRLGTAWSELTILSNRLVQSSIGSVVTELQGSTNILISLPGVVLDTLDDEVIFYLRARAREGAGSLDVLGEVVGNLNDPAITGCLFTNTLGAAPYADTMSGATISPVNGQYYAFDQDRSRVAGFGVSKTVRLRGDAAPGVSYVDARIGEDLTYRIEGHFFGVAISNAVIYESLPNNVVWGTPVDVGSSANVSNLWTWSPSAGSFTLPTPLSTDAVFVVDIPVVVSNRVANQGEIGSQTIFTNVVTNYFQADGITNPPPATATTTTVKEASLQISKISGSFGLVQAGDTVVFTSRVSHTASSATNAYDLTFTDMLPSGFTFTGVDLGTDGYDNDGDGSVDEGDEAGLVSGSTLTITTNNSTALYNLALGQAVSFVFPVKVLNQSLGSLLVNTGKVTWTSLAGPATNLNERDGSSGVGGLNDYLTTSTATLTSRPVATMTKTMFSTSQDHTTTTNLTIGERVVYKIRVDFPPGIAAPVTIVDNVTTGLDFVGTNPNVGLAYPGLGYGFYLPSGGPVFPTNAAQGLVVTDPDPSPASSSDVAGSDKDITFTIGGITNVPDGNSENDYFELYLEYVVLSQVTNNGLNSPYTRGSNVVSYSDTINSLAATSETYRIVEPDVSVRKVRSGSSGTVDAGNVITFSLFASNKTTATANSYDILVTDNLTNKFWDLSSITPLTTAPGWTFSTITSNDLVQVRYASDAGTYLAPGTGVSNSFSVTVSTNIAPNVTIANRMDIIISDTINGSVSVGTTSRNDTANHSINLTAGNFTLAKALWSSSETDSSSTNVQVGEAVTYRLTVTLPEARMTNLVVTDILPPGLAYVYGSASTDVSTLNGILGTLTEAPTGTGLAGDGVDPAITFSGVSYVNGDNVAGNNAFYLYLTAVVLDTASNTGRISGLETRLTNSATINCNGGTAANSGIVVLRVIEPVLTMGKSIVESTADAGDVVTMYLYVTNSGLATAYDVEIQDPLDATFFAGATATAVELPTGFQLFASNNTVYIRPAVGQTPPVSTMEVGEVYTCRFTVAMAESTPPYGFVTNVGQVASADTILNDNGYGEARDVSGAEARDSLQSGTMGLIKALDRTSETRPSDSTNDLVQVGELITYRMEVALPEGTVPDITVTDFIPPGLAFVMGTVTTDVSTFNGTLRPLSVDPAGSGLADDGQDVTFSFPGNTTVVGDNVAGNNSFFFTFQAVVLDVAGNHGLTGNQTVLTNRAELTFTGNTAGSLASGPVTNRVIEPLVTIGKDINRVAGDAGDAVTLTFVVTNGGLGAAYDLRIEDRLEERFFEPSRVTTGSIPAGYTAIVTGAPDRYIVIQASAASGPKTNTLDAGEILTFTMAAVLSTNVSPGLPITNAVVVTTADSIYGTALYSNERDASGARGNDSLTVSNLLIAKSFISSSATGPFDTTSTNITIGETATYRLTVTLPESTIQDMVVTDLVPAGMSYVEGSSSVDVTGFAGSLPAMVTASAGGDGDDITFTFTGATQVTNDNSGANNSFTISFTLLMLDQPSNDGVPTTGDGDGVTMLTNRATVWCPPCQGTAPTSTPVVVAAAEPYPLVSKRMSKVGTLVSFAFTVTNRGNSTGYDLDLEDFIPGDIWQLNTLTGAVPAGFVFAISNVTDGALIHVWSDPASSPPANSIEVNEVITYWFTGTMVEGFSGVAVNTAKITRCTTLSGPVAGERDEPDLYGTAPYGSPNVVAFKRGTDLNGLPLVGGDRILYRIVLTNAGGDTATGVVLRDLVPTNTTLVAGSVTNNGVASDPGDPAVTVTVGSLNVNQAKVVSFMVTVDDGLPLSVTTIWNRATATWAESVRIEVADNDTAGHDKTVDDGADDADDFGVITSDDDPTILPLDLIDYDAAKTLIIPSGRPALLNERVQFRITVTNSGSILLATTPLVDTYSTTYLTYQYSVPPSADNQNDGTLNWANLGALSPGQSTSVVVTFIAKAATVTTRTNTVVVSPTAPSGFTAPQPATKTAPYDINGSTYASLSAFRVLNQGGTVEVTWETEAEVGTAGFQLVRIAADGTRTLVGEGWVAAAGSVAGGFYRLTDPQARVGEDYHYELTEIGEAGGELPLGEFTGTVPAPSKAAATAVPVGPRLGTPVTKVTGVVRSSDPLDSSGSGQIQVPGEGVYGVPASTVASMLDVTLAEASALLTNDEVEIRHRGVRIPARVASDGSALYFFSPGPTGLFAAVETYALAQGRNPRWPIALVDRATTQAEDFEALVTAFSNRTQIMTLLDDPQADFWVWEQLAVGPSSSMTKSFTLTAREVSASAGSAQLAVALMGGSNASNNPDHHVRLLFNGGEVADAWWEGKVPYTLVAELPSGLLREGTNTVAVVNVAEASIPSSIFYVDELRVTYRRSFHVLGDYLRFRVEGGQSALLTGFGRSDIQLLEVSVPETPRLVTGAEVVEDSGAWSLLLPSTETGHVYVAFTPAAVKSPAWAAGRLADGLTSPTNQADHLVVCAPGLEIAGQHLVDHRRAHGVDSRLVPLQDIYDAFASGMPGPAALRAFVDYAWRYWATAPASMVLLGDGTYDYQNSKGYNDALLPPVLVSTPLGVYCSDAPYGDVEGDDGVPEVVVGRIPVATSTGAVAFVEKLIAYESQSATWTAPLLLLADNNDAGGNFTASCDGFAAAASGRFATVRAYLDELGTNETRRQVLDRLNSGVAGFNFAGHGTLASLCQEGLLRSTDVPGLTNGWRAPFFISMTCVIARYAEPGIPSLGELLLLHSRGGVVAAIGPVALSSDYVAKSLNEAIGRAWAAAPGQTLGQVWKAALTDYHEAGHDPYLPSVYNVLGDPATVLK